MCYVPPSGELLGHMTPRFQTSLTPLVYNKTSNVFIFVSYQSACISWDPSIVYDILLSACFVLNLRRALSACSNDYRSKEWTVQPRNYILLHLFFDLIILFIRRPAFDDCTRCWTAITKHEGGFRAPV